MVVSMYSVDTMIKAYNKQHRVTAKNIGFPDGGGEKKGKPSDEVTLSQQGVEAAEVYSKISNRLIDNILKNDKQ